MKIILFPIGKEVSTVRELYHEWRANLGASKALGYSDGERDLSLGEAIKRLGGKALADCAGIFELFDEHGLYVGQIWGI